MSTISKINVDNHVDKFQIIDEQTSKPPFSTKWQYEQFLNYSLQIHNKTSKNSRSDFRPQYFIPFK
jgi:hypothetical protein